MYKTFSEIKVALEKGRTVQDILQKYLDNIKERSDLNAFLEVFEESAMKKALEVDEKIKNGNAGRLARSEEHTSELQSRPHLVCRLLLEKKKQEQNSTP